MIKEIVQFTAEAMEDSLLSSYGIVPKIGLHIVLNVEKTQTQTFINHTPAFVGIFSSKKKSNLNDWFIKCAKWWKSSTMLGVVNTNKVLDTPSKAIHTVSPFCFGVKRSYFVGGKQFMLNARTGDSQFYDRINAYFAKASNLLDVEEDKIIADAFRIVLNDKNLIHQWIDSSGKFQNLKDEDYIIFYLDLPIEQYNIPNRKYLKSKLLNKEEYNKPDINDPDLLHGASDWLNSFSDDKPFLKHQSASFNISARISSVEAQHLSEFTDLVNRKLFPNPLPLFVMTDERKRAFKIFKDDLASGEEKRRPYLEIIETLQQAHKEDVGNYYLLFQFGGEIKDFDYVSKFDFNLKPDGSPWVVRDLFETRQPLTLIDIKDLLTQVLPPLFNNALVVRRKDKDWSYRWFDDIDPFRCKTHNAFLMAMKYRKAFYDYIYKSKRQGVTGDAIHEILLTGILDDIRLDEFNNNRNSESFNIRLKLNLLFNLHQYFSLNQPNTFLMPAKIIELKEHINAVARGEAHIEKNDQFAFAAGQMIARIFMQSETANRSFKYIEPFLRQTNIDKLKQSIQEFFVRYSHKPYAKRFACVSAEVLSYDFNKDEAGTLEKLRPVILAGIFFRRNLLLSEDEKTNEDETQVMEN